MRILSVVGTRPNFVKLAPLHRALRAKRLRHMVVHTGQHYDPSLSDSFFHDLQIPPADRNLDVGSGTHSEQTAKTMLRLEPVLMEHPRPDWVLVYGDVNSTLAATLCAKKLHLRVGHIESGIRHIHEDFSIPEELNRIMADHISDFLFAPTATAARNLRREGIPAGRVKLVGNTMYDTLVWALPFAKKRRPLQTLGLPPGEPFVLVTLHRPENVDDPEIFKGVFRALHEISRERRIVFPAHPRTKKMLARFGLAPVDARRIVLCDPFGYLDFLSLMLKTELMMTDSGSIQDETSFLGVPCLTVRNNSDRPETFRKGFNNHLVGNRPAGILRAWKAHASRRSRPRRLVHAVDDGKTARRIVECLLQSARA